MNRLALLIFFSLISYSIKCQIQIQEIKKMEKDDSELCYDVNKNIQYHEKTDDYAQYIGLDIVFLPKNKQYISYENEVTINDCFYEKDENSILIPIEIKSDDIFGNTFKIIDFKTTKTNRVFKFKFTDRTQDGYFVLKNLDNNESYLYRIPFENSIGNWSFYKYPFFIISYLNEIKKSNMNSSFIVKESKDSPRYSFLYNFEDINTGVKTEFNDLDKFTCVDLRIMDAPRGNKYMQPFLIFENKNSNQIRVSFLKYIGEMGEDYFKPSILNGSVSLESDFNSLAYLDSKEKEFEIYKKEFIKIFGKEYGTMIVEKKVRIGMSAKMCEYSWGKPISINKSSGTYGVREQWVYGDNQYLYFDNGKLTDIQSTK